MTHRIFDKTNKGREEIATRKHQLPTRLRTLLVLVDGKQSEEELLKKVAGIGLNQESIAELLDNGFIQVAPQSALEPPKAMLVPVQVASAGPETPERSTATIFDGKSQFLAIYEFYTETIKSMIGLRGYALQLRVEKAASIDDFRALRDPYLEAVLKSKGKEIARSLRARLDQLLYMGETVPSTTVVGLNAVAE